MPTDIAGVSWWSTRVIAHNLEPGRRQGTPAGRRRHQQSLARRCTLAAELVAQANSTGAERQWCTEFLGNQIAAGILPRISMSTTFRESCVIKGRWRKAGGRCPAPIFVEQGFQPVVTFRYLLYKGVMPLVVARWTKPYKGAALPDVKESN